MTKRLIRQLVRDSHGDALSQNGCPGLRQLEPEERAPAFAAQTVLAVWDYMGRSNPDGLWDLGCLVDAWQLLEELGQAWLDEMPQSLAPSRSGHDESDRRPALCNELLRHLRAFREEPDRSALVAARVTLQRIVATHRGYSWRAFLSDVELKAKAKGAYRNSYFLDWIDGH